MPFRFLLFVSGIFVLTPDRLAQEARTCLQTIVPFIHSPADHPGFSLLSSSETGITFTNILGARQASQNQVLPNGSGVAAGDVDGDGNCDLYFCALEGSNKLFRNLGN